MTPYPVLAADEWDENFPTSGIRQYPDELRERAEAYALTIHPPTEPSQETP